MNFRPFLQAAVIAAAVIAPLAMVIPPAGSAPPVPWTSLGPGLDYRRLPLEPLGGPTDAFLHVVRILPSPGRPRVILARNAGGPARTPAAWCRDERLAVAVNLGMYRADDPLGHVGYLRLDGTLHGESWNGYRSLLLLGPAAPGGPAAAIVDLDDPRRDGPVLSRSWPTAVQNLRLVAAGVNGPRNVWEPGGRPWSEAALAEDGSGRLLVLFLRYPLTMPDFNRLLLASDLDVRRAMHLEGGAHAGLSIHSGGVDLDLGGMLGSVDSGASSGQFPIPNILGVALP